MNMKEIKKLVADFVVEMSAKGLIKPDAQLNIIANGRSYYHLSWETPEGPSAYEIFFFDDDDPFGAGLAAAAWIKNLPDAEEKAKSDALALTAKALEASRAAGLEPEFLNPLEAMMKKLSENVITDQSNDAN